MGVLMQVRRRRVKDRGGQRGQRHGERVGVERTSVVVVVRMVVRMVVRVVRLRGNEIQGRCGHVRRRAWVTRDPCKCDSDGVVWCARSTVAKDARCCQIGDDEM